MSEPSRDRALARLRIQRAIDRVEADCETLSFVDSIKDHPLSLFLTLLFGWAAWKTEIPPASLFGGMLIITFVLQAEQKRREARRGNNLKKALREISTLLEDMDLPDSNPETQEPARP